MQGTVKILYKEKGFGFVTGEDKKDSLIPLHIYIRSKKTLLEENQKIEYDIEINDKGQLKATNISIIKKTVQERNPMVEHDTEDKPYWCKKGEIFEDAFVENIVPKIDRNIIVHPKKKEVKTYIDLLNLDTNTVADLKTQNKPFFTAEKYGYDPQFTVSFNVKDYKNYCENYPEAIIYWWVNWDQLFYEDKNNNKYQVDPLYGVWEVPFKDMKEQIESGEIKKHEYINRKDDDINAKDSYLFNLNSFNRLL